MGNQITESTSGLGEIKLGEEKLASVLYSVDVRHTPGQLDPPIRGKLTVIDGEKDLTKYNDDQLVLRLQDGRELKLILGRWNLVAGKGSFGVS